MRKIVINLTEEQFKEGGTIEINFPGTNNGVGTGALTGIDVFGKSSLSARDEKELAILREGIARLKEKVEDFRDNPTRDKIQTVAHSLHSMAPNYMIEKYGEIAVDIMNLVKEYRLIVKENFGGTLNKQESYCLKVNPLEGPR